MLGGLFKALVCLSVSIFAFASVTFALDSKYEQKAAMDTLLLELNVHYGMAEFKKEQFGVTLEKLRAKYAWLIENATTLEEHKGLEPQPAAKRKILSQLEFQQLMMGLIAELRDGHVNALRQTRNAATLGIRTVAIDGRLYVAGFHEPFFLPNQFTEKVEVGDEIVEVDGESVQTIARKRLLYAFGGTFESRWDRALRSVIEVPYSLYMPMPEGKPVDLKLKKGSKTYVGRVPWVERRDYDFVRALFLEHEIDELSRAMSQDTPVPYGVSGYVRSYFRQGLLKMDIPEGTVIDIGKLLNQELWQQKLQRDANATTAAKAAANSAESPYAVAPPTTAAAIASDPSSETMPVSRLMAYIVHYKGKNIGVLRIPSYSPGTFYDLRNELLWLKKMMPRLQASTDMLILDVLSNAGGSVFQASRMTSFFARNSPISSIKINLKLNETLLEAYRPSGGYQTEEMRPQKFVEWHLDKKAFEILEQKFKNGEKWSGYHATFSLGVEGQGDDFGRLFAPFSAAYKKPILILNDRFSGSGGDFVPAILQAAERAYVMGETSMGLGGPVYRNIASMPGSELSMRCTIGMCLRSDGLPIENLGVIPDIPRHLRVGDLKEGFKRYTEDVLEVALGVIEGKDRSGLQSILHARHKQSSNVMSGTAGEIQRMAEEYNSSFILVESPEDWVALMESYWSAIAKAKDIGPEHWRKIELRLPTPLVESDLLLSSLWRRDEVLARLQEMQGLPAIRAREDLMAVIKFILDWAHTFDGEVRFGSPCELQLLSRLKGK